MSGADSAPGGEEIQRLLAIVTGSWMSQAAYVAARLGISDLLADRSRTSDELAEATGAHAPSLRRLMRALTAVDLCRHEADGTFALTPLGSLLRTDAPDSLRSWTLYWGGSAWPLWGRLLESVRTGESARKLTTGAQGFEHLEADPEAAAVFHQAMAELTRQVSKGVVERYDFEGLERIVDVGGGAGELLAAILVANPDARGVLMDLAHAVEAAKRHFEDMGLERRCELVVGSFFESVPEGGDAYVLKSVIHDWDDDQDRAILENCRRAMHQSARVLLVERVLPARLGLSFDHQSIARSDLHMLLAHTGRERTEAEFRALLDMAGLRLARILPVGWAHSVLEAFPAE